MEEYPRTVAELESSFGTEAACREYLHRLRFPEGFRCPRCQGRTAWTTQRNLLVCAACQYQLSLTAGTIFQAVLSPPAASNGHRANTLRGPGCSRKAQTTTPWTHWSQLNTYLQFYFSFSVQSKGHSLKTNSLF